MNWRLPRDYRDYLPGRDSLAGLVDGTHLSGYLPSRLPSLGLFDRRRKNTELALAVGVGAAALIGLCAGAYLVARDRALAEEEKNRVPKGRSDFGHGHGKS